MTRDERRKLAVEVLRDTVITSAAELAREVSERSGEEVTIHMATTDLRAIGAVRTPSGSGWRYRTADLVTEHDVAWALEDRMRADGLDAVAFAPNIMLITTTKGTANAVGSLVKMLKDHDLDDNIAFVLSDNDECVLVGLRVPQAKQYASTFKGWVG